MGMDVYGRDGSYFGANVWSWRPICYAMGLAGFDVPSEWHMNDGAGLTTQAECDQLADKLATFLSQWDGDVLIMESDMRVDAAGRFVDKDTPGSKSAYSVEREHLEAFITFLRECGGGFEIW